MENRFNLIDEDWIPVADHDRVSLRKLFSNPQYRSLGGNPVQKIAVLKLLLAIAQAAATPQDDDEWQALGADGLARRCLAYLKQWHAHFYLYGDRPFLQIPEVKELIELRTERRLKVAKTGVKKSEALMSGLPKGLGVAFYPDLPSANNTMLSHTMMAWDIPDADKALFIVTLMNFSFAGKRVEADMKSLSGTDMGNRFSAPAGPSLGGWTGYLHSFSLVDSIVSSIWINMLTLKNIASLNRWSAGLGYPVWERRPAGEADAIADNHKQSYQATLLALSRFVLLDAEGIYYLNGIAYPGVKDGWYEPSLSIDYSGKNVRVKYVDPSKRPWREIESLLSFLSESGGDGFECYSVQLGIERGRDNFPEVKIWSGGLKVSANSGDQSVKQSDDFVESQVSLHCAFFGQSEFAQLKQEMDALDTLAKNLYGRVMGYYKELTVDGGKLAPQATQLFWQLCERHFQHLVDHCDQSEPAKAARQQLRRRIAGHVQRAYDQFCPRDTARQLSAWAKQQPNNSTYLKQEA